MIPTFAVVGHPNKGKSSIVATLAEDDGIAIGPEPGTTTRAVRHTFTIDGAPQYVLVDTPGFQRARAVLAWLNDHATSADERPAAVRAFIEAHGDDARFRDECELLRPIVEGAGILYVIDGTKPYGSEYELEMQILQWTGQPRMALINLIGPGDHVTAWRHALDQYFSIVRLFDAVQADFDARLALLRGFGELDESWREPLEHAVLALQRERDHRMARSAAAIADGLIEALTAAESARLGDNDDPQPAKARLVHTLQQRVRTVERRTRDTVQSLYRHAGVTQTLAGEGSADALLETDPFTREGWQLFGLSRLQLVVSGAISGAVAGGSIDVLLGGASLLLGAGIGALVGGAGAAFAGEELARVQILGESLGGRVLHVGPVSAPNFPWVLLGRAWLHHHLIAERNHARREAVVLVVRDADHLLDDLPADLRRDLARTFDQIRKPDPDAGTRDRLADQVLQVLRRAPVTDAAARDAVS